MPSVPANDDEEVEAAYMSSTFILSTPRDAGLVPIAHYLDSFEIHSSFTPARNMRNYSGYMVRIITIACINIADKSASLQLALLSRSNILCAQSSAGRTAGLVVFSQALRNSPSGRHLSDSLLNGLIEASRYLICELLVVSRNSAAASTLLALFSQLVDKLLFAHGMWPRALIKVA
nr:hypothetical transcript [Hymenolepis microstoma]